MSLVHVHVRMCVGVCVRQFPLWPPPMRRFNLGLMSRNVYFLLPCPAATLQTSDSLTFLTPLPLCSPLPHNSISHTPFLSRLSASLAAMSDPILSHPHTQVLAQLLVQPQASSSPRGRRHRRTSSGHSHTNDALAANPASSSSPQPELPALPMAVASSPMPKLFKVEITHNGDCKGSNPVFYPSDLIHGMVYLSLNTPMTLPALKIVFKGESNYPSSKQQDHLDHHMRRLFSVAMTLWGSRDPLPEDQWGQLPAGNHTFPFTIQLPDKNLPASFDHPWLKNQYTLTAYYRRPNGLSKWQSKAKEINFMPLSAPGLEHGPIQESCPKMGTALLLSHPDLTPGGRVHVKMTAAAAIDRCHFSLSRHIRARINETTYSEDEVICHYERKSIPKGEFNLVLPIPKITPPTTESLSAIKITYSVQVSIWNERFFIKTESHNFDFPIVIRTLPSCDDRACEGLDWCEPSVDRPMFLTEESILPLPLYNSDRSPPTYTIDLPSYEQCVDGTCSALGNMSVQGQALEGDHDHHLGQDQDQDNDHGSTHSGESTHSDVEGHERMIPHPSYVYYAASKDRPDQPYTARPSSSLSLSSATWSNDTNVIDTAANNGESSSSSNQNSPAVSIPSSSSSQHSTEDDHHIDEPSELLAHARAVEYLKVHTTFESA